MSRPGLRSTLRQSGSRRLSGPARPGSPSGRQDHRDVPSGTASPRLRRDHPLLLRESLGDLVRQVCDASGGRAEQPSVLLLDELVYARDWDLWLKTFYDDQWPVQVIATSSATAALRHSNLGDRRQESGVGRWSEQFLLPYLFTEYLDLVGNAVPCDVGETLAETVRGLPARLPEPEKLSTRRYRFLLLGGFPELLAHELAGDRLDDADRTLLSQQVLHSAGGGSRFWWGWHGIGHLGVDLAEPAAPRGREADHDH